MGGLPVIVHVTLACRGNLWQREYPPVVLEFSGVVLPDELSHHRKIGGCLPLENRLPILLELTVGFFHRGVVVTMDCRVAIPLDVLRGGLVFTAGCLCGGLGDCPSLLLENLRRFFHVPCAFLYVFFFRLRLFFFGSAAERLYVFFAATMACL